MKKIFLCLSLVVLFLTTGVCALENEVTPITIDLGEKVHCNVGDANLTSDYLVTDGDGVKIEIDSNCVDGKKVSASGGFKEGHVGDRVDLSFKVNSNKSGRFVMNVRSTAAYGEDWISPWEVTVNNTKFDRNNGLVAGSGMGTTDNKVTVDLVEGENTITFHVGIRKGTGTDMFFFVEEINFFYDNIHNTNFQDSEIKREYSMSGASDWSGRESVEFHAQNLAPTDRRYIEFKVDAKKAGLYKVQSISSQVDHGWISQYDIIINGNKVDRDALQNNIKGEVTPNPTGFFRNFEYYTSLKQGENIIRYELKPDVNINRILFYFDKITFTYMPQSVRVEGEQFVDPEDIFSGVDGGTSYLEFNEFSQGKALFTFRGTSNMQERNIKYIVDAPKSGIYDLGFLCGVLAEDDYAGYGTDMDISINGKRYTLLGNSQRTVNSIGGSGSPLPLFQYIYNDSVELHQGVNEITVHAKKRPAANDIHFVLDWIEFNFKEEISDYSISNVKFNDKINTPIKGNNNVAFSINNKTNAIKPFVTLAVYRGNKLLNVFIDNSKTVETITDYTFNNITLEKGDIVKIFVWNEYIPYCDNYIVECTTETLPVLNVLEVGNTALLTTAIEPSSQARDVSYDVKDYWGNTVQSGNIKVLENQTDVVLNLGNNMPVGWYNVDVEKKN